MPETNVAIDPKATVPPVTQGEKPVQIEVVKQPDLVSRVSQHKVTETKPEISEPEFDFKNIESIKDPVAKEQALSAYKSFQKGFNQKFQELSEQRKTLEQMKQDMSTWTPEKVQALTANEQFLKAAQSVVGVQNSKSTDSEYSAMSETEKARVAQLEKELTQLKNQSYQQIKVQQDEQLKTRYANYDSNTMDMITNDVLAGKAQITREHVWKAYDYDSAIKRAYELGKQDKIQENTEKVNSMSFGDSSKNVSSSEKMEPNKGESDRDYLKRLFFKNISVKAQQK